MAAPALPLTVIVKIDVFRFAPGTRPTKYKPPLRVDPDGMKSGEIATSFLEMIARRHPQVLIGGCRRASQACEQPDFKVGRNVFGTSRRRRRKP